MGREGRRESLLPARQPRNRGLRLSSREDACGEAEQLLLPTSHVHRWEQRDAVREALSTPFPLQPEHARTAAGALSIFHRL